MGTGEGAIKALEAMDEEKVNVLAYIDNNESKHNTYFNDLKIISPLQIYEYEYDYIVIASSYYDEIYKQLADMSIPKAKIVTIVSGKNKTSKELVKEVYDENLKYKKLLREEDIKKFFNNYFISNMNVMSIDRNIQMYDYYDYLLKGIDYVRVSTVELLSKEISDRSIEGSIAELGVYKGDFSKVLSNYFKERKLFLFDTFEGFTNEDILIEKEENYSNAKVGHLGDTNESIVLDKVYNKNNCVIKKGYFPDTAIGLENENFAFVSIDVDLFNPTYEGLKFFYKRLNRGGYIIIHDYNHKMYTGVKEAVNRFCDEEEIGYFPLSDYHGSVIITK